MMMCTVCGGEPQGGVALCHACTGRLDNPQNLCIEHIAWTGTPPSPSGAALIDQWGRPHYLRDKTIIGRTTSDGIAVLERSISRDHAEIVASESGWQLRDLGSRNGTSVANTSIESSTTLESEQVVTFGDVAFFFLARPELTSIARIHLETEDQASRRRGRGNEPSSGTTFRLVAPPGADGGIIEMNDVAVRLSSIQFAFVSLLAERIRSESDLPELVRGYVRATELLSELPWDSATPVANNVRQLVRRVRTAMEDAGLPEIIESRHRFGYRLRLLPQSI